MPIAPPPLDACFPMDATRASLAEWDEGNRLAILGSFLESLSLAFLNPSVPRTPPRPTLGLRADASSAVRALLDRRPIQGIDGITADEDRLYDALQAYERASETRTFRLRILAMNAALAAHMAYLGICALLIWARVPELLFLPLAGAWLAMTVGAKIACERWIAPRIYGRQEVA